MNNTPSRLRPPLPPTAGRVCACGWLDGVCTCRYVHVTLHACVCVGVCVCVFEPPRVAADVACSLSADPADLQEHVTRPPWQGQCALLWLTIM